LLGRDIYPCFQRILKSIINPFCRIPYEASSRRLKRDGNDELTIGEVPFNDRGPTAESKGAQANAARPVR
jgi:hypothetical protein